MRIGIVGFHDTAFEVAILDRHDSSRLSHAVADLPCRVKMVSDRNIAEGLQTALRMVGEPGAGRKGIILITSGDSSANSERINVIPARARQQRVGIHVVCLGPEENQPICGPRIQTKYSLGYGSFRVVNSQEELLAGIRDAFDGLAPAFGMSGINMGVILLDCSETMVEVYRNTTRIEMIMASLKEYLRDPLVRSHSMHRPNGSSDHWSKSTARNPRHASSTVPEACYDWSPGDGTLAGAK